MREVRWYHGQTRPEQDGIFVLKAQLTRLCRISHCRKAIYRVCKANISHGVSRISPFCDTSRRTRYAASRCDMSCGRDMPLARCDMSCGRDMPLTWCDMSFGRDMPLPRCDTSCGRDMPLTRCDMPCGRDMPLRGERKQPAKKSAASSARQIDLCDNMKGNTENERTSEKLRSETVGKKAL